MPQTMTVAKMTETVVVMVVVRWMQRDSGGMATVAHYQNKLFGFHLVVLTTVVSVIMFICPVTWHAHPCKHVSSDKTTVLTCPLLSKKSRISTAWHQVQNLISDSRSTC